MSISNCSLFFPTSPSKIRKAQQGTCECLMCRWYVHVYVACLCSVCCVFCVCCVYVMCLTCGMSSMYILCVPLICPWCFLCASFLLTTILEDMYRESCVYVCRICNVRIVRLLVLYVLCVSYMLYAYNVCFSCNVHGA